MTKKIVETNDEGKVTGRIIFRFDDHKDDAPSEQVFELSKCNAEITERLAIHGAGQKIGDSYASAASQTDPLAFAKAQVQDLIKQLYAPEHGGESVWRSNAGSSGPRVNDLAVALARVSGEPLEGEDGTIALVAAMSDEEKKTYRNKPKIKAALAAIAAEKAVKRAEEMAKKAAEAEAAEAALAAN